MSVAQTALQLPEKNQEVERINTLFAQQKAAYRAHPMPSSTERRADLQRLKDGILKYKNELADAIYQDFSCRSKDETMVAEVMTAVQGINFAMKRLKKWMKPSKRHEIGRASCRERV